MSFGKHRQTCRLYQLPRLDYEQTHRLQQRLVANRKRGQGGDLLLLLEHPPVYTLGRGSAAEFVKFVPGGSQPKLIRTERGGEVTYHCPGQLVGYPVLDLSSYQRDLHWYLRQLEEVIIVALRTWNITSTRIPGLTGVWVDGYKVAAIGIKVSRWITMHGFAINVCPDLAGFEAIVPCGIADRPVGAIAQFVPGITLEPMRLAVANAFAQVFQVELEPAINGWQELQACAGRDEQPIPQP
ncbi:lipoyl(octanoyl) transferase [filamentous cyanobacterium CCP5]|nr:lipoyl(octanoyl) transferase [filamentous cyanobacterium CCP5]